MTMRARHLLLRDIRGVAAAEMALVAPLLLIVMFGSFELGNYFYDNHIVIKSVRDGARYASRRSFADYDCPSTVDANAMSAITNVTRTGQVAGQGTPRLANWSATGTVFVTVSCTAISGSTPAYAGIYAGRPAVPVVSVAVTVPYSSIFSNMVFDASTLSITAESRVPVMGI